MLRKLLVVCLVLIVLLLAACGPSEEEIAALTAAAATSTPLPTETPIPTATPTPTPTPIPIDLTVTVTDGDGNAIAGAYVALPESGDDTPVMTDDAGQVTWTNLPAQIINLNASAQAYLYNEGSEFLELGPNEVTFTLERDPFGLLPSEACAPDEALLYLEDFQDRYAEGWPEVEFNAPGWHLGVDPGEERAGNVLMYAQNEPIENQPVWATLQTEHNFENAVWRIWFNMAAVNEVSFNWLMSKEPFEIDGTEVFDSRYQLHLGTNNNSGLRRLQQPLTNISVGNIFNHPKQDTWHYLEVGTFDGATEVYLDGLLIAAYEDPQVVPPGTIALEVWPNSADEVMYFDNISVCEISAPFQPIYVEPATEEE